MAVDWGEKRIGVALADGDGRVVRPYRVIQRESDGKALDELAGIAAEWEVARIVVGAPFNMDGSAGPQLERVRKVALRMEGRLKRPVVMLDERLTSAAVRAGRDDEAAAVLLASYFRDPSKAVHPARLGNRGDS